MFGKIKNTKKYTPNENSFMPNFAFHNFEQLLKHMENTGKTHGEHRENTWSPQGKHREHTRKTQGLHNPTITALYGTVYFGKIKNTKKFIRLTKIFSYQISHFIILNNF